MENIISTFCKIVQENSERIAILDGKKQYSYKELDEYSNYIAKKLGDFVKVGDRVGICIERSFKMIAAILGALKAGMAYVPLDSNYPGTRLEYMCTEAKVSCILCEENNFNGFANTLVLDEIVYLEYYQIQKNEEAYIIFTSGSTGIPKGVSVSNFSIMNTLNWRIKYYSLKKEDIVLQIPSISYSSSVEDIFSTLLSGGKLVLICAADLLNMRKLSKMIIDEEVTHILLIPSLYQSLLPYLKESKLRFVVVAGESLSMQVIEKHFHYLENVKLFNEYGMTETSVAFSAGVINKYETICNIGEPIDNMRYCLENVEDGIGELVVYGPGVANGYINDMKDGRFISKSGERAFYTGDLISELKDGRLVYCGRKDQQIKQNGKRFDLREITYVLKEKLNLEAVAVKNDNNKIVCYVQNSVYNKKEIDEALRKILPIEFLPYKYKMIDKICRLPNGKIDFGKLKRGK